jgi:fumarylacetoacetate (FAA) hydrolase
MKLATYKDGSRDGQLIVVSRDLNWAHYATGIAHRLQQVLDDWSFIAPQLQDLYETLNQGKARHAFPFNPAQCMAPLPRAFRRVEGCAYLNHAALTRRSANATESEGLTTEPLLYLGSSDNFLGPCDDIVCQSESHGIDFGAELAVVTADVPAGAPPEQALDGVRLVMLANDVSLRQLSGAELPEGLGSVQSKLATAFSPVAVTLDELGEAWNRGRVDLTLQISWNGRKVGICEAGPEMTFHFGELIAQLCKTRGVRAGSIVGSGTLSNKDRSHGYACIAEKRAIETLQDGKPSTEFMRFGDSIRLEMKGRDGASVFGAIEQKIAPRS